MDQAITRAAGAAPRAVGEFEGYVDGVDGIKPSVRWLDRKNMPQVGDRLFAIPARAAVPRTWAVLLTSENHGIVGPVGHPFRHAGEKHERVQVMEVVEAGSPPAPGVDLVGLARFNFVDIDGDSEQFIEVSAGGYFLAHQVEARCAGATPVAAQVGQVAVPEKLVADIDAIADELEAEAMNYEGDFADTVKGCAEALRMIVSPSPAKESK